MYKPYLLAAGLLTSQAALAIELFETNPTTPYPPGCISTTLDGLTSPTGGRQVYGDDVLSFSGFPDTSNDALVNTQIFRRGCIEENRSILFIRFEVLGDAFFAPNVSARVGPDEYELRLVSEPNTFESSQSGRALVPAVYEFIVDGLAESAVRNNTNVMTPTQYSGPFTLRITDFVDSSVEYSIALPAWNTNIKPIRVPLQGRLSGVWVAEGATDQGLLISFNELVVGEETQQFVFFSWYTFDAEGNTLWITAGDTHNVGASELQLDLQLVTNGEFMGDKTADREVISTATLRVESCNEMTLTYDLSSLGLGMGTATLLRLSSLETSGYACRDLEARLDAL